MFYVYDSPRTNVDRPISIAPVSPEISGASGEFITGEKYGDEDIDFVDDALLNTAPHNAIEQQLLRGDVIGLALMSGAIIWSAMGAFG